MSYKKVADLVAITGKYQSSGGEKNRYLHCGILLADGDKRAIKLSCIPIDDSGQVVTWLNIFPIKDRTDRQQSREQPDFDDKIPF